MDALLALLLTGAAAAGLAEYLFFRFPTSPPFDVVWAIAYLSQTIPLAWRCRSPLVVLLIVASAVLVPSLLSPLPPPLDGAVGMVALLICVYTIAAHSERVRSLIGAAVGLGTAWLLPFFFPNNPERFDPEKLVRLILVAGVWALGDRVRLYRRYVAGLEDRRAQAARQAIAEERRRIARELHDVVAHGVSLMGIQAGAARMSFEINPAAALEALALIESGSRQAVVEMHRLLGVLRDEDGRRPALIGPQPGLNDLAGLIREVREAGLEVELEADPPQPLPAALDLSAYRIVQEALTNVLKHAGSTRARVRIRHRPEDLEIEVANERGERPPSGSAGRGRGGYGLVGMRERVDLFQGELQAGPAPRGGFVVKARLPLETDGR